MFLSINFYHSLRFPEMFCPAKSRNSLNRDSLISVQLYLIIPVISRILFLYRAFDFIFHLLPLFLFLFISFKPGDEIDT